MPTGSDIRVEYDGTDITRLCLFASSTFDAQASAVPGMCQITVKDTAQALGFRSGRELRVWIDDIPMWGGFTTRIGRKLAFDVDDTTPGHGGPAAVKSRQWVLDGVDYNILFDKRFLRYSSAMSGKGFLTQLKSFNYNFPLKALVTTMCRDYLDLPYDLDYDTMVEDGVYLQPDWSYAKRGATKGDWTQQGTSWRKQMEDFTQFNGVVWYINASKQLVVKRYESVNSWWGFSDFPNKIAWAPDLDTSLGATYGFRELEETDDGTRIVNDALVWGGSEWAGQGKTVFARDTNNASVSEYSLWQAVETHFGESGFGVQDGVSVRAQQMVEGTKSGLENQEYGMRLPQAVLKLSWFAHDVPTRLGVRSHLTPGTFVNTVLYTYSEGGQPKYYTLPLREVRVSFPTLDPEGNGYVRFDGTFALQSDDPWTLWRYLMKTRSKTYKEQIATVTSSSEGARRGDYGRLDVMEQEDGSRRLFTVYISPDGVPTACGYIAGSADVYLNGLLQHTGRDFAETSPENGQITFTTAPRTGDWISVHCRTAAA